MRKSPARAEPPQSAEDAQRALLGLLGLAARARALASGTDAARQALRDGKARCLLLAADASPVQAKKVAPLAEAVGTRCFVVDVTREALGHATGRGALSAVAVLDEGFAKRMAELAALSPYGV